MGVAEPTDQHERPHWDVGHLVVGVDEVGRGALAGPVTVGAVVLNPDVVPEGLRDSKQLSAKRRAAVAALVHQHALHVAVMHADASQVDRDGINAALADAATRAVTSIMMYAHTVLLDGDTNFLPGGLPVVTIEKGDRDSVSIAAASIVAKVARDMVMLQQHQQHPQYGFDTHKGYGAASHLDALREHGPTSLHRQTWKPIAQPTMF